jgi:hypothetical protein
MFLFAQIFFHLDTPLNFLKDSNANFKMKTTKVQGIKVCSLARNTSRGVRRTCWNFRMGIKTIDKQVNYSY